MENRERLGSRLGFIMLSAGCAIGCGNVWKFPYMAGQGGGGAFVLFYLIFLVILGLPIMTMEFAVGRASKKSPVKAYQALEKPGQKWHIHGYFTLAGCYLLMMFYTTVAGWMLHYFYMTATGKLSGLSADAVADQFTRMLADPGVMMFWMVLVVVIGVVICAGGLQNGLERVTKVMMSLLLVLMAALYIQSSRSKKRQEKISGELAAALERTEEATTAKQDFFSKMSHDIRTPLNVVLSMTQIAQKYKNGPEKLEIALNNVTKEGNYLLMLINSILDVNQLEHGMVELVKQPFDPAACLRESADMLRSLAEKRGQQLTV